MFGKYPARPSEFPAKRTLFLTGRLRLRSPGVTQLPRGLNRKLPANLEIRARPDRVDTGRAYEMTYMLRFRRPRLGSACDVSTLSSAPPERHFYAHDRVAPARARPSTKGK